MTDAAPPGFLDVELLLVTSQPQARPFGSGIWVGIVALIMIMMVWAGAHTGAEFVALRVLGSVGMLGVMIVMVALSRVSARANNREQRQLLAIEESIQLRRWTEAGAALQSLLSRPMRTYQGQVEAIIYLAAVLARYHRFDDASAVYDYLLQNVPVDESLQHSIKLGRAMAILQVEHLFDADRAIADLRRYPDRDRSAALALLEIARDVKTGHPQEAAETFEARLPILRQQLGHRLADAWALVARAYDLLGRESEAQTAFENATLLAPQAELARRYTEVKAIVGKYHPALLPPEAV